MSILSLPLIGSVYFWIIMETQRFKPENFVDNFLINYRLEAKIINAKIMSILDYMFLHQLVPAHNLPSLMVMESQLHLQKKTFIDSPCQLQVKIIDLPS